jgi:hypothetical protein
VPQAAIPRLAAECFEIGQIKEVHRKARVDLGWRTPRNGWKIKVADQALDEMLTFDLLYELIPERFFRAFKLFSSPDLRGWKLVVSALAATGRGSI